MMSKWNDPDSLALMTLRGLEDWERWYDDKLTEAAKVAGWAVACRAPERLESYYMMRLARPIPGDDNGEMEVRAEVRILSLHMPARVAAEMLASGLWKDGECDETLREARFRALLWNNRINPATLHERPGDVFGSKPVGQGEHALYWEVAKLNTQAEWAAAQNGDVAA